MSDHALTAANPYHEPAGSDHGGEFARRRGAPQHVRAGEVYGFPEGIIDREAIDGRGVFFAPIRRASDPVYWKAVFHPDGREAAFWFAAPTNMGEPMHRAVIAQLGPDAEDTIDEDEGISGGPLGPDYPSDRSNEVYRRHIRDIRDYEDSGLTASAALSDLNAQSTAALAACLALEDRAAGEYAVVLRQAARRASVEYKRQAQVLVASGNPYHQPKGNEHGGEFAPKPAGFLVDTYDEEREGYWGKPSDAFVFQSFVADDVPLVKFMYGQGPKGPEVKLWTADGDSGDPHHVEVELWLETNEYQWATEVSGSTFADDVNLDWRGIKNEPVEVDPAIAEQVRAAIERHREEIEAMTAAALVAAGDQGNVEGSEIVDQDALAESLVPIQRDVLARAAIAAAGQIGVALDVLPMFLEQAREQQRDGLKRFGEYAVDTANDAIHEATVNGLGVREAASLIQERGVAAADWQARTVARTQMVGTANAASLMAARLAGPLFKTWLTAGDELVRPDHVEANGQTVPLGSPFQVGGEPLMFPGDPNGSDGEVINCRCTLVYTDSPAMVAAAVTEFSGSMVSLPIEPDAADEIAIEGGQAADTLHVTLAFLPGEADPDAVRRAVEKVEGMLPLEGSVNGIGEFAEGADGVPVILIPGAECLHEMRQALVDALDEEGVEWSNRFPFQPHVTVTYAQDGERPDLEHLKGMPLSFSTIEHRDGDRVHYAAGALTAATITIEAGPDDVITIVPAEGAAQGIGFPELDREVAYQVKFFYDHGYWSPSPLSQTFLPEQAWDVAMTLAPLLVSNPELPVCVATRKRLIDAGLLY